MLGIFLGGKYQISQLGEGDSCIFFYEQASIAIQKKIKTKGRGSISKKKQAKQGSKQRNLKALDLKRENTFPIKK